jgi:TatD DNase family protein
VLLKNQKANKLKAMIKYVDIHSHLGFDDYGKDLGEVIKRMEESGVATITIGTDLESSNEAVKIADENKNIFACIGVHPADKKNFVFEEEDFAELVKNPKVVAIGECGLDYFRINGDKEVEKNRQKREFIKQIEFSIKYNKPLMLHIRDGLKQSELFGQAYSDAYEILKKYKGKARGNMHFFAGSFDWAKKFIELGFTVSFTGVITFARQYDEIIKNIPLDKIHAETDSPYVAPIPFRGKRNEPTYVVEVIKKIAEICGEDFETVRIQLINNAKRMFSLEV